MTFRILILMVLLSVSPAGAAEKELGEFLAFPLTAGLTVYQRGVSPHKGARCAMMPSDSAYARQALRRHGALLGTLMAIDRLHRCGHDRSAYPLVWTDDGPRLSDPLEPMKQPR